MKKVGRLWNKTPFKNRIAPPLRRRHARQRKNCWRLHTCAPGIFLWSAALPAGILPVLKAQGVYLAAQCCEHLNRAIVIEQEAAEKYGYEQVNAVPQPHAGGSWATNCWQAFEHPVLVEEVRAAAGIDIGGTLIGMHLKRVAVPVRLTIKQIGAASIICARTRPKYIGGSRAVYQEM